MTFTTFTFILFLVLTLLLYWLTKKRLRQNIILAIASYVFYGWWDYRFCFLLFASTIVDFFIARQIHATELPKQRRFLLITSLIFNLGLLCFFKYWNFFTGSLASSLSLVGWNLDFFTLQVILPVGISFYTFQTLSYTIDVYRRQLKPANNLIDYVAYLSFFPQLVAGPIERATHLLPQIERDRYFDYEKAVDGCRQMLWGFSKKMLIADNLAPIVDNAFSNPQDFSGPQLIFATIAFAFQIYCDFSAYSDIAIGTARLFGIELMRNFAYPYFSQSLTEFWRRWHISLSTWLRDYIYFPLGGSRVASQFRAGANVMITFLLSGLWHGASWNFVVWGGLHGGLLLLEKLWIHHTPLRVNEVPGGFGLIPKPAAFLRMALTFTLVCITWIFFRVHDVTDAGYILHRIAVDFFNPAAYQNFGMVWISSPLKKEILLILAAFIAIEWIQRIYPHPLVLKHAPKAVRFATYSILFWTSLIWGTWSTGQFVYFQF